MLSVNTSDALSWEEGPNLNVVYKPQRTNPTGSNLNVWKVTTNSGTSCSEQLKPLMNFDSQTMKSLAIALLQSHCDYASTVWYTSSPKNMKTKIQTFQSKLMRVVLDLPPCTHTGPSQFTELEWLSAENSQAADVGSYPSNIEWLSSEVPAKLFWSCVLGIRMDMQLEPVQQMLFIICVSAHWKKTPFYSQQL